MTQDIATEPTRSERIDIGDGLLMRWSTKDDVQNIADTLAECFRWVTFGAPVAEDEDRPPNAWVRSAGLRLLRGDHTVMDVNDYAVVENTLAKKDEKSIVACVCLMHGPGYYGKVSLRFGKPEVVACLP
ncbi:hypothetical protein BG004_006444, partial [Podila humilis]